MSNPLKFICAKDTLNVAKQFAVLTSILLTFFQSSLSFASELLPDEVIQKYAPRVFLNPEERYNPSSVEFFFNYVVDNGQGALVTQEHIPCTTGGECPSRDLDFFYGHPNATQNVPVYAVVVPKHNVGPNITDVVYFTFYPFNQGKSVCMGKYVKYIGCVGIGYRTFGNHVGDWEHVLVRFDGQTPIKIVLSQHTNDEVFEWNSSRIQKIDTHPIVYSASGSHGLYAEPGRHTYKRLPNDNLNDDTGSGYAWDTWYNISIIDYKPVGFYTAPYEWMNYKGDWGNPKEGCGFFDVYKELSGECKLVGGPSGPAFKVATDPNAFEGQY